MAPLAGGALGAVAEGRERTTDRCSGGHVDVGKAAGIIGAVATEEMGAGGHAVVGRIVGEIAMLAVRTGAGAQEVLADGHLVGIMGESAGWAKGTCT